MKISHRIAAAALVGASALAVLAPAAQAAPESEDITTQWYVDFLERDPATLAGDRGRAYWVTQIDAGLRPSDALWAITHSNEYHVNEVTDLYQGLLARTPDAGASYWVNGLNAGSFPLEWVAQNILASPEYAQLNEEGGLVNAWYADILDRTAGAGEVAYWEGRLAAVGPLTTVREIYYASEAVEERIETHYENLLGRPADGGGLTYWYPREVESDINVQVLIASTPEYAAR